MSSSITADRVDFPIADVVLQQPDWLGLPMDILELIFWHLRYAADLIRIRAVCRKWRSVVNTVRHKPLCPLLLLDSESNTGVYDLFDFSKNKILRTQLYATDQIPTDLFIDRRFTNSCNGWLARMDYSSGSWAIHLINPFTRVQIQLPPTATFEEDPPTALDRIIVGAKSRFLRKAVLSSTPLDPKCVVMAIYCIDALYSGDEELKLALCSPPRDTSNWKTLKSDQPKEFFVDIIYFMDQFYALGRSQELFRCDIINSSNDEPKVVPISPPELLPELEALLGPEEPFMELRALLRKHKTMEGPELEWTQLGPRGRKSRSYLVDWCGDLLMVVRYAVYNKVYICKTARFKVFKFDFGRGRWDEIDSLGDGSIFVSYSATALLSVKEDFPEFKPNCIYFTDDNHAKGWLNMRDAGVFCLSTKVCKPWRVMAGIWPPPFLWISPDLRTSEFILSNLN